MCKYEDSESSEQFRLGEQMKPTGQSIETEMNGYG